mmetsp:Transcript_39528/g.73694  ORF Transcript_39528/g.73694 Transcript_39528/m.73694 type:complete len:137 (-) Transcript_39528:364-774(-)
MQADVLSLLGRTVVQNAQLLKNPRPGGNKKQLLELLVACVLQSSPSHENKWLRLSESDHVALKVLLNSLVHFVHVSGLVGRVDRQVCGLPTLSEPVRPPLNDPPGDHASAGVAAETASAQSTIWAGRRLATHARPR